MHTLIEGRGRYVLIHADEDEQRGGGKRVESFVVGGDVSGGERAVWIVEGGKYKASFLLEGEGRLLISEVSGGFGGRGARWGFVLMGCRRLCRGLSMRIMAF